MLRGPGQGIYHPLAASLPPSANFTDTLYDLYTSMFPLPTHVHLYASTVAPVKAKAELGWAARRSLEDMCKDLWAWQSANPNGYADTT